MKKQIVEIAGTKLNVYSLNTIVVGSGAAGLNAAKRIYDFGQHDLAIVTEGLKKGTSRNTGSDKQTYYKLSISGKEKDSIYEMAETLFDGGAMHGDIALVEAALSLRSFFHLVEIGVPFPHTSYGEYLGYKTDHDPRKRGTSVGPLTSHYMTEKLEKEITSRDIKIFSGYRVIAILKSEEKVLGVMAINIERDNNPAQRYVLFNAKNTVYATGGPAKIYSTSVYPESQSGATGVALEEGVKARNLTESQYGLASTKFRWNLSGTYQQVLPRYISTDQEGNDQKEFLLDYFSSPGKMLDAIFLKGYQWPFDPRKVNNYGSSLIDICVYNEMVNLGRRVWLDYTQNLHGASNENNELDFSCLGSEAYSYLEKSQALFGKPIGRLKLMNQPAIDLYKKHGIDLEKEYLEVAVCAQHNNGGLAGNKWWESNLKNFFPVGEVNGSHGIYRPGGSALNSGQVGSLRAAEYITQAYNEPPRELSSFVDLVSQKVIEIIKRGEAFCKEGGHLTPMDTQKGIQKRMSACGGHIREINQISRVKDEVLQLLKSVTLKTKVEKKGDLTRAFENYDLLITQFVFLSAIEDYINNGGKSRGSYLIIDPKGENKVHGLPGEFSFSLEEGNLTQKIQEIKFDNTSKSCRIQWVPVRKIPSEDYWFENEWRNYRQGKIFD